MVMIRPTPAAMNVRPITVSGMPNVVPMIVIIQTFGKKWLKSIFEALCWIVWNAPISCLNIGV